MTATALESRDIETTTLPNGIRVISERMPHVRSVSVGIWVGTGSRHETPRENGISHFIEHMLFKGTATRSAEEIAREVDSTGGHLDAYTSKELVSYNTKVLDATLPRAFDVLADMVLHPTFRPEDIEKEKGVILEELKSEVDNPEYMVHELFSRSFYPRHALGRSILGTKDTIRSFDQAFLQDYFRRYYNAGNITITAAGRLQHRCMVELVADRFAVLRKETTPIAADTPRTHPAITVRVKKSLEQVHLVMGVPSYSMSHPLRYAAYIMSTLLGGGMSSRLFQNVREKRGLAYSVFCESSFYRDCGCLAVYAGTSAESLPEVVRLVLQEFRDLKQERVGDDELRRAKDYLKGSIALSLESTSSRMQNLARQALYYDRFLSIDEMVERVESVTADQVQQVAQDHFRPDQLALTALGPLEGVTFDRDHLLC